MIDGSILLGAGTVRRERGFKATDPATNASLDPLFGAAQADDLDRACMLAESAFPIFVESTPKLRATFLEKMAEAILGLGDTLVQRAILETGLPRARLEGERGRTVSQLRLFAETVRSGAWIDATIDPELPDRLPLRRPDLRRRHIGIGPVAVFGTSNFPLAFSVAGGDTAAAFAAGCPVVFKGHPSHPGTGELVARAIQAAVTACNLPEGIFSFLPSDSHELARALVADPRIKAAAFTGSRQAGVSLMAVAAARPEPIPVYAEMGSINPVVLLSGALSSRSEPLAQGFINSLTLGSGQFCTNPGLILALDDAALDHFIVLARSILNKTELGPMLNPGIFDAYRRNTERLERHKALTGQSDRPDAGGVNRPRGNLFVTQARDFMADRTLMDEVFGPCAIIVKCCDPAEMIRLVNSLEGQLTASIHMDPADEPSAVSILQAVTFKVGRIVVNDWPTGVEVSHAIVHGGPFPATSDGRSTSVGSYAIHRFLRPVCYQDVPEALLPTALRTDNPWNIPRVVSSIA